MNQDEEVPTRVTRGALRRRSVDREATPQKSTGAASSGTPKKSASTTKKVNSLNAIQESEGRPSTPIVGRNTRRRMSETIDTPTSLPNKLVQNLKEAESSAETGRRSRNSSLTEENINELNAAYEGGSGMMPARSRTPARLRASHETLASTSSPQTFPAVRRSTRRNSVTSDDGSVQSIPVTIPKVSSSLRTVKDDPIIEEDASDDRAESVSSEASSRTTRRKSTAVGKSPSPRSSAMSPDKSMGNESTPPRTIKTPRVALSSLTKGSPRSKNVSFSEDSKLDDNGASFCKTPATVPKAVVVMVEDIRNSELKGMSPKVDTEVDLPMKCEVNTEQIKSPKRESVADDAVQDSNAVSATKSILASPNLNKETSKQSNTPMKQKMNVSSTVPNGDRTETIVSTNDVSGIEVMETSVVEISDTLSEANTSTKHTSQLANQSASEGDTLSRSWSQSVRRSAAKGIDEFSVRKQEEQERLEEETEKLQMSQLRSPLTARSPKAKLEWEDELTDNEKDDQVEDEEEAQEKNEFIDDEVVEMEGYESGDSLASDLKREMEENEIPDQGEDLGSEDTEENDEQEEDEDEDGNDSWIVSSGEEGEQLDEDDLLQDTDDEDLKTSGPSLVINKETKKTPKRRRIIEVDDDSDQENIEEIAKSPKKNSSFIKRAATPSTVGDNESITPTTKMNQSQTDNVIEKEDDGENIVNTPVESNASIATTDNKEEESGDSKTSCATPNRKTPSKDSALNSAVKASPKTTNRFDCTTPNRKTPAKNDGSLLNASVNASPNTTNSATPNHKTPSKKDEGSALSSADKSSPNTTKSIGDKDVTPADENDTSGNSDIMFHDAENGEEAAEKTNNEAQKDATLVESPSKDITSRKSFPFGTVNSNVAIANGRKSLPAAVSMQSSQEKAEKEETQQDGSSQNDDALETSASETNASVVEDKKAADEGPANSTSAEVTQNQLASEIAPKPDRKSMPAVSLISAQFYIGGSKKRATIGGADMKMLTSTPKPTSLEVAKDKPKKSAIAKKANAANSGSSVVPNPFALGNGAKVVKSRLSLDSGATAQAVGQQKAKKSRLSLPTKFIEEDLPTETTDAVVGNGQAEEPVEPMEVDEEPEQGDGKEATKPNAAAGEKNDEVVVVQADTNKPKVAKPKPKALEDYDLANILSRCNEIVREDKERKKELASILRKKKEEKKRLRELEKQQELEAAKSAAEGTPPADTEDGLNSSATGNDDSAINQGGEGLKKKKKRKPKVKNYLLEELAETKKERLEQALRHKLEIIERRKQRKKERQLDQKKQVDKENGNDGVAPVNGGSGGIGAKLEKMKKKQKAKANDEISKQQLLQGPPVRIALSAFAVFNQLHNNQPQVAGALQQHEKQVPEMQPKKAQLAPPAVEKKQNKISPKKEEISEPTAKPEKVPHDVEEKENKATIPSETEQSKKKQKGKAAEDNATVETTPAKENETLSKKKAIPAVKAQSESALEEGGKDNVPYVAKSVSEGTLKEADKKSKKQKRKLAALELVTEQQMESDVNGSLEEAPPKFVSEKQKDKKRKQLTVDTMSSDIAVPETISKQKKLKKLVAKNEDAENRDVTLEGKKTAGAMDKIFTEGGEVKEKKMKKKKAKNQSAAQAENGSQQDRNAAELSRKKLGSLEQQDTAETPAITKTKKRKRDQGDESPTTVLAATPRPAKHTKLRVLQRIESGGFFEETVTPDRIRMKRNFGFQERQATPAKQLGFRVSSILPTDQNELRAVASSTKTHSKDERKKAKNGGGAVLPEPNRSLPLPVWTSGGMFLESEADDGNVGNEKKMTQKQKRGSNAKTDLMGGYIQLNVQGKADFRLKTLRPETTIEKPHRVDASTTDQSILNFKRKQLLEKTAHLRVKKKSHRM